MSDDAIQDLLDEMDAIAAGDKVSHWTITRARGQHEAHRARVAELTSALEGRAVEVAGLQAKVARLESAIADQVIADGVARGG